MDTQITTPTPLRGHHLFCLQFFHGTGYSADFARNLIHIMEGFHDEEFVVIKGHDIVCSHCPRRNSTNDDDCILCPEGPMGIEGLDDYAMELIGLRVGDTIAGTEIERRTETHIDEWRERACNHCAWKDTCAAVIDLMERT